MHADDHTRTAADPARAKAGKARKPARVKADADGTEKRSLNLRIDTESYRRLSVHALMADTTISALVEGFAKSLKGYSMPHRLGGAPSVGDGEN